MPDLDLEPGDYSERKPKGWRWKLPWSHPQDTKLPMVLFFISAGFVVYFFLNLPAGTSWKVCVGIATFAALAGAQFILWLGRD
jgi:hypothetical protein